MRGREETVETGPQDPGPGPPAEPEPPTDQRRRFERAHAWRERIRSRPHSRLVYRVVVGLVGGALTLGGLALVPLPGPGWAIVIVGLYVLASEFTWAERLRDLVVDNVRAWTRWLQRQPLAVRAAVALATAGFVLAVVYAVLLVIGVPGWVPEALVPPGL